MKILHILNHFLPRHIAGTEMYAYSLGKNLNPDKYEVVFVIPNYGNAENEVYQYDGFRVIRYGEPSVVDRSLQMGKRAPDGLKNFLKVLEAERPDIVHFHEIAGSNGITIYHVALAKEICFKVVMTFHLGRYTATSDTLQVPADVFNNFRGALNFYKAKGFSMTVALCLYPVSFLLKMFKMELSAMGKAGIALGVSYLVEKKKQDFFHLVSCCDRLVAISHWYYNLLLENGVSDNKLNFIEQGIDFDIGIDGGARRTSKKFKLIFVGRISHFKGVKLLIEAILSLCNPNVQLDIYGDSGENDKYIDECKLLAAKSSSINFRGRLMHQNTTKVMSKYDVLVLPSTFSEMSPLVIREAFAAGIPVLASASMGAAEQIQNGVNGWLFKMNDKNDLIEKLKMLITHPEKIEEARKHLPPVRTMKEVAAEYEKVYERLAQP